MTRSTVSWSKWEEKNPLAWLESNRRLTWKALTHAYCQQFHVNRSIESLRGKKYHILRKQRRASIKPTAGKSQPPKRIQCKGPIRAGKARPVQRRIDRWLEGLSMTESSQADCNGSTETKCSTTSMPVTPFLLTA
jgi:hypothetical protein